MRGLFYIVLGICLIAALAGCETVSMPYVMKMNRTDQDMYVGNRGYLKGTPPPAQDRSGLKREWIAVDVDLIETGKKEDIK